MKEQVKSLLDLITENPDLPVIPMVDCDVVGDDTYGRWIGSIGTSRVEEYTLYEMYGDGEEIVKRDRVDDIAEYIADHDEDMTDEEIEKFISEIEWKKAIFLNINTPD